MCQMALQFDSDVDLNGTHLLGYLDHPYLFAQALSRLYYLADYNIFADRNRGDIYKSSFGINGSYEGKRFSLYDYKDDERIHIGGDDNLNLDGLKHQLLCMMETANEPSFVTHSNYTFPVHEYSWPTNEE